MFKLKLFKRHLIIKLMSSNIDTFIHISLTTVILYGYYYFTNKQQNLEEKLEDTNFEKKFLEYKIKNLNDEKCVIEQQLNESIRNNEILKSKLNDTLEYCNILSHEKEELDIVKEKNKKLIEINEKLLISNEDEIYNECYDVLPCNNVKKKTWFF